MKVLNSTKKTLISSKALHLKSSFAKTKGLMGDDKSSCVYFKTRFGVHTFFLKSPIDLIVLDSKNRVKVVKKDLLPNRVFFWNPIYSRVIEAPSKTIQKSKTQINDIISFNG